MSVTVARHESGEILPLHAHPVPCVVHVVGGAFLEASDDRTFSCGVGDLLVRPADSAHVNRYGREGARYVVIEIPGRLVPDLDEGDELLSRVRLFRSSRGSSLVRDLRRRAEEDEARAGRGCMDEQILELLGRILPRADQRPGALRRERAAPSWLRHVHDRVSTGFVNRPSVQELAAEVGVHPDHVSRAFRRHFGFTLTDLVRRRRVEHAAEAIRGTRRALAAIAYDSGFSDQSHMTRQVKRHLGVTPLQLRRLGRRSV